MTGHIPVTDGDPAREFITFPILQTKAEFLLNLAPDARESVLTSLDKWSHDPAAGQDVRAFLNWLHRLACVMATEQQAGLAGIVDEGATQGFVCRSADVLRQFMSFAPSALSFWESIGARRLTESWALLLLAWQRDERNTARLAAAVKAAQSRRLIPEGDALDVLTAIHRSPALIQAVGLPSGAHAPALLVTHEVRRFVAAGLPLMAGVAAASVGGLVRGTDRSLARRLVQMAIDALADVPELALERLHVQHVAVLCKEGAEYHAGVSALVGDLRAYLHADGARDVETVQRVLASLLIEHAVDKQERGENDSAVSDYDEVISTLSASSHVDRPFTAGLDLASAYMNRGNAKRKLPNVTAAEVVSDYQAAVELRVELLKSAPPDLARHTRTELAIAYRCVIDMMSADRSQRRADGSAAGVDALGDAGPVAGVPLLRWVNPFIETLAELGCDHSHDPGTREWRFEHARQLVLRGDVTDGLQKAARLQRPRAKWADTYVQDAITDFDEAIAMLDDLQDEKPATPNAEWRSTLAKALYLRATARRQLDGYARGLVSTDLMRAREIWTEPTLRASDAAWWALCSEAYVMYLAEAEQPRAALAIARAFYDERAALVRDAIDSGAVAPLLRAARRLPHVVAVVCAQLQEPRQALSMLLSEQGIGLALSRAGEDRNLLSVRIEPASEADAMARLAEIVPAGGALVVPAVTDQSTVVFAIDHTGTIETLSLSTEVWNNTGVMSLLPVFAEGAGTTDEYRWDVLNKSLHMMTRTLWRDIVGPIWDVLESRLKLPSDAPVTFITQGVMDYMPLHIAGREVAGQWRFAIEDRVIRFAPSLAALSEMKRREARGTRNLKVAGFFDPLGDLPASRTVELTAMIRTLGSPGLMTWIGEEASKDALLDVLTDWSGSGFTDLHLSVHGVVDIEEPRDSYVVLAGLQHGEGARLSARELLALPRIEALDHVSLASCASAGLDPGSTSGEAGGLVGAFIHLGARSLLAFLYPLLDRPTAVLMPAIYRRRRGGADVAEAVRDEVIERLQVARALGHLTEIKPPGRSHMSTHEDWSRLYEEASRSAGFPLIWWAGLKPICAG